jgi:NAD(P)-dependent dehydrogenase (short-subunit alcohol dehydrogenase family)
MKAGRPAPWRTAIVTGGASGIGQRLAVLLASGGANVAVLDRSIPLDLAAELGAVVSGDSGLVVCHPVDVCDPEQVTSAVSAAVEELGAPDLVINSAGISSNQLFVASSRSDFERTIAVNLFGSRNLAAAVVPHLQPGSRLALIASLAGITGGYTYAAYASSKAAVIGLAKVLRLELAPAGIGVSVVCPPEILTPMVEQYRDSMHPVTRALKDVAGTLPIESACAEILDQLARGRFTVIPGSQARRTVLVTRLLPERATNAITDRIVRRTLERHGEDHPS